MRVIIIPTYLLDDTQIADIIARAEEVMTELAGEQDTTELPPLIQSLRSLLKEREQ